MRNGNQKYRNFRMTECCADAYARIKKANYENLKRSNSQFIELIVEEAVLAIEDYMDTHGGRFPSFTQMRLTASTGSLRWLGESDNGFKIDHLLEDITAACERDGTAGGNEVAS